jgi:multidrug efflux system membrane fusion protein
VQRGTPGTFVYVVAADRSVSIRKVALGPVDGENVAADGLAPGELVVVDGADRLREGATVELAGEAAPGGRGGAGKSDKRGGGKGREGRAKGAEGSTAAP